MIQLRILSGRKAGTAWAARRFPVRIGRSARCHLQLEEDGIWDEHLQLDFRPAEGVILTTHSDAITRLNGQPVEQATLRNGDAIELGSLKLEFWLGPNRQPGLGWREWLIWFGIAAVTLGQIGLIYWLLA